MSTVKKLRVFAGPNGSGKSTLVPIILEHHIDLGVYVNADNLKLDLNKNRQLNFGDFNFIFDINHFSNLFKSSSLYKIANGKFVLANMLVKDNRLFISEGLIVNDYFTSFLASYLRIILLDTCDKFTFETVMSHPSKLEFIREAKAKGFKIYIYFVSLSNPLLNIGRVKARVKDGGHDVPEEKVIERYQRTMDMLIEAIKLSDRSFIFDNSHMEPKLVAESEGDNLSIISDGFVPLWFQKYVIDKLV